MINVFFDTEFTTIEKGEQPFLISIACVAQNGRDEFYAELTDTWHERLCSTFVKENVLPLLKGGAWRMKEAELAIRLQAWLEGLGDDEVVLRSDAPQYDWPWVEQLFTFFGCWPKNLRKRCGGLSFESDEQQEIFDATLSAYWNVPVNVRHHALTDAQSLAFAWWHAQAKVMSDADFAHLLDNLLQRGLNDGDIGYAYWWAVRLKLKELRGPSHAEKDCK